MSSSKGSGAAPNASFKGKGTSDDQLSHAVLDMNLNSSQGDDWEEYVKKFKIKNRSNASKQVSPQNPGPKVWGNNSDTMQKLGLRSHGGFARGNGQLRPTAPPDTKKHPSGRGFTKPQSSNQAAVIPSPLENGWGWSSRAGSTQPSENGINAPAVIHPASNQTSVVDDVDGGEDSDDIDDIDDELLSDGFDSDKSQKSHETGKKNRWFKDLFQCLDELTVEQINEPERQWHCPACKGGPGVIDWYRGLLPVISHAKTKRSKRVKLHRELAELLDEELKRRGTSAVQSAKL
ncbi:Protein SUPPRESSOR OF GENE SILENCING [Castilleja foliolosa]|uniref:Protein SUPPRESSOR OF GENE SILENCING n=1 Tax=Castilleja foliolosa TaxID=1961234 RepID=A0ABD3BBN1_9LAMI